LGKFRHGLNQWKELSHADKKSIWECLNAMQSYRCAYCETSLLSKSGQQEAHIEHFRQRCRYLQGTFDWSNLFGSCNRQESCGKHKDRQTYDHSDLIKVDDEDPEHFFRFLADGLVLPADHLSPAERLRAEETIRVFNLNGPLRQIRKFNLMGYLQTAEEIVSLAMEFDDADWRPYLDEELNAISGKPFETAIRHVLQIP
jgi:uncharacterized protein (TIGR02646 family)